MKLSGISNAIKNKIFIHKIEKKEANIAKNVVIHGYESGGEGIAQIYNMREAIANYLKKQNLKLDVFEKPFDEKSKTFKHNNSNIEAVLTDLKNPGKRSVWIFDGDVKKVYPKESFYKRIVDVKGEDTQIAYTIKKSIEDNFLSHFLRSIEDMVREINKKNNI